MSIKYKIAKTKLIQYEKNNYLGELLKSWYTDHILDELY